MTVECMGTIKKHWILVIQLVLDHPNTWVCSDPGGHECIGLYSDMLTLHCVSQQFCHLFGDWFVGYVAFSAAGIVLGCIVRLL